MRKLRGKSSPAMVVAVLALVAGVAGAAVAQPVAKKAVTKKKVKKIAKKQADKEITRQAPGLSVAHANTADNANTVGGHSASCPAGTRLYLSECWETASRAPDKWVAAATTCEAAGGHLPSVPELATFSDEPGITLAMDGEWTDQVITPSSAVVVDIVGGNLVFGNNGITTTTDFRCVIPLLR